VVAFDSTLSLLKSGSRHISENLTTRFERTLSDFHTQTHIHAQTNTPKTLSNALSASQKAQAGQQSAEAAAEAASEASVGLEKQLQAEAAKAATAAMLVAAMQKEVVEAKEQAQKQQQQLEEFRKSAEQQVCFHRVCRASGVPCRGR